MLYRVKGKTIKAQDFRKQPYRVYGGYRFILATMVLVSHAAVFLPDFITTLSLGNVGVFSFFILSGFVISEALDCFYRSNLKGFLLNRFLKLFPAYWGATIIAFLILSMNGLLEVPVTIWSLLVNFSMVLGHFPAGNNLIVITIVWAVIIEIHFYIIAGLVHTLGEKITMASLSMAITGILALLLYFYVEYSGLYNSAIGVFRHAPFFVAGAAYYYVVKRGSRGALLLAVSAFILSIHSYWIYISSGDGSPSWLSMTLFILTNIVFIMLAYAKILQNLEKVDKRLGDITYALYLVHMPIIVVLKKISFPDWLSFAMALTFSIFAAVIIYYLIERPVGLIRDKIRGLKLYG